MRLLGVVKSVSILSARLGVGNAVGSWIVEEFTAQMHAVSKIALHRRTNLAAFLETNGMSMFSIVDCLDPLRNVLSFWYP